ncbi:MAG: DUF1364 domain-containing protein [Terriglobia bacterium]|nr:DUF1364 domain-containing protein [Terriglobia bacterium]
MSWLTQLARGQRCTIRLGCCNGNSDTTVLAHYRSVRLGAGTSHKPHDLIGAFACSACHDEADRRTRNYDYQEVRFAHAEGCLETFNVLLSMGKIGALKRGVEAA